MIPSFYSKEPGSALGLPARSAKQYDPRFNKRVPNFQQVEVQGRFIDPAIGIFNHVINYKDMWFNTRKAIPGSERMAPTRKQYIPISLLPERTKSKSSSLVLKSTREKNEPVFVEIYMNEPVRYETDVPVSMNTTHF